MSPRRITSPFTLSFIARRTRRSGVRGLGTLSEQAPNLTQHTIYVPGDHFDQVESPLIQAFGVGPGFSAVYFLSLLETEVNNGGFNQMFHNNGREAVVQARNGAEFVRLQDLSTVIGRALAIEESTRARCAAARDSGTVEGFMATYEDGDFEAINDQFSSLAEGIEKSLIRFIRNNVALFSGRADG